jgi:short-subunit dehydrogenase
MTSQSTLGTALITGASTGIGAVYADRLARRGYDLILVARNQERLSALAASIGTKTGRKVSFLVADLNRKADLLNIEKVLATDPSITLLVNNAGVGAVAPLVSTNVDDMEALIDLNVKALTRLTYAAAPAFVARGAGAIIQIASVVGISTETLNGVYGASKAFVIALTQSLQHELADKGVRIQAVLPGATATPFWDVAGHARLRSARRLRDDDRRPRRRRARRLRYGRGLHDSGTPRRSAIQHVRSCARGHGPESVEDEAGGALRLEVSLVAARHGGARSFQALPSPLKAHRTQ